MLDAYFDESGTHGGSETVAVAGLLATADVWRSFETRWQEALVEYGLPFFHMSEFARKKRGSAYDWAEEVRRERLGNLISIINEHTAASIGVAFPKKLFDSVFTGRVRQIIGGPYGFASWVCVNMVSRELDQLPVETGVSYIFEDGAPGKGELMKVYEALPAFPGGKAGLHVLSLRFEDKKRFLPLQAADILAYELNLDRVRQSHPERRRKPLQLFDASTAKWQPMTEPNMKACAAVVDMMMAGEVTPQAAMSAAIWQSPEKGSDDEAPSP